MYKTKIVLFVFGLLLSTLMISNKADAQAFLNGNFEINTCTAGVDQINLSNVAFNAAMANTTAFGSFGDMDIITTATYSGLAQSGLWYVAFTGGGTDAIAMQLTTPLVAGNTYSICFYDRADANFTPMPVQIGVSATNNSFGTIVYTASAAATVGVWTQRTATFVAPLAGQYITVQTTGALGNWTQTDNFTFCCSASVSLGNDTTICTGGNLTLDAGNAGATYVWSTGATTQTINVNTTGTYWVTATILSCSATDTIHVSFINPPVVNLGNDTTLCAANNYTLDAANAGANYLWNTGATTQTININTTGTYWVIVGSGACADTDSISVTFVPVLTVNLGPDVTVCANQTVTLDAGNVGSAYLWSTGATTQTISPTVSGTYSVTVTSGGCTANDAANVTFTAIPIVNLGPDQSLCNVNNITLNAGNAGAAYLWNTTETTQSITVNAPGQYYVIVTNGACVGRDTILITGNVPPAVNLGPDTAACQGTIITLDAGSGAVSYFWSTTETTQTIKVSNTGTYFVVISNGTCNASDTINVHIHVPPYVFLGSDTSICDGEQIMLDAGLGYRAYSWSPIGSNAHFLFINHSGIYTVQVTDENGCTGTSSLWVKDYCPDQMYVPNAFTPNGDTRNNYFSGICQNATEYHLYIFNRWGELIFESQDLSAGWDGKFDGNNAPEGIYIYRIDYSTYNFDIIQKHSKVGKVTLLR